METYDHLIPEAAHMADRSDPVRFSYIERDKVIETPVFLAGTRRLAEIYAHHEILRPPNVAIYGLSGIGKSHLLEEFERQHPKRRDRKTGQLIVPVLRVQLPFVADERWFLSEISLNLGYPDTLPRLRSEAFRKVIERLGQARTRVIILDEYTFVLHWSHAEQRRAGALVRWLSNESRIPIVLAGTELLPNLIAEDIELARRFEHMPLPCWECDNDFAGFIQAYIMTLPLRRPSLLDRPMAEQLHLASQGITHTVVKLLQAAAKQAILSGAESITLSTLKQDAAAVPPTIDARPVARRRRRRGR